MRGGIALGLAWSVLGISSTLRAQEPRAEAKHVDDDSFFYVGGALQGPLPLLWVARPNGSASPGAGVGAAFRGAYVHHHFEVLLELSGAFATAGEGSMVLADGTVTVGGLIPMSPHLSWPMRFGAGGGASVVVRDGPVGFAEARADVFGVAVRTSEHLRVELDVPSYRIMVNGDGLLGMSWVTALTFAYVP